MSAILDALDYLTGSLDKPGRAVRGLLADRPQEAMALVPFSDTLGLTDPANAVSGRDLLSHYGVSTGDELGDAALGVGADILTDPTTYLGGALGRLAGRAIGRGMEAAAAARGPGYATTVADLMPAALTAADGGQSARRLDWIGRHAPSAFSEVPEGSSLLGAGAEGVAFRTPAGDVVRLGRTFEGTPGRPAAESVLQAVRAADYPTGIPGAVVRAERVPLAGQVGELDPARMAALRQRAAADGLDFSDFKPDNAGFLGGADKIIDPGAVAHAGYEGGFQSVLTPHEPSVLTRALLDALGGRQATRRAIDAGLAAPEYERGFGATGALAGASLGAN